MGRKSPSERGYHPVMLRQSVFERLQAYAKGESMSAAVERLLDSVENGGYPPTGEGGIIHLPTLEAVLRTKPYAGWPGQRLIDDVLKAERL